MFCLGSDAVYASEYFFAFVKCLLEIWLKESFPGDIIMTAQQLSVVARLFSLFTDFANSCHRYSCTINNSEIKCNCGMVNS